MQPTRRDRARFVVELRGLLKIGGCTRKLTSCGRPYIVVTYSVTLGVRYRRRLHYLCGRDHNTPIIMELCQGSQLHSTFLPCTEYTTMPSLSTSGNVFWIVAHDSLPARVTCLVANGSRNVFYHD